MIDWTLTDFNPHNLPMCARHMEWSEPYEIGYHFDAKRDIEDNNPQIVAINSVYWMCQVIIDEDAWLEKVFLGENRKITPETLLYSLYQPPLMEED